MEGVACEVFRKPRYGAVAAADESVVRVREITDWTSRFWYTRPAST